MQAALLLTNERLTEGYELSLNTCFRLTLNRLRNKSIFSNRLLLKKNVTKGSGNCLYKILTSTSSDFLINKKERILAWNDHFGLTWGEVGVEGGEVNR